MSVLAQRHHDARVETGLVADPKFWFCCSDWMPPLCTCSPRALQIPTTVHGVEGGSEGRKREKQDKRCALAAAEDQRIRQEGAC
eukprot:746653-Rhodomonas_salina.4